MKRSAAAAVVLLFSLSALNGQDRNMDFSGYLWDIRHTQTPAGPGPNVFLSSAVRSVLGTSPVLSIEKRGSRYICSEISSRKLFGFGRFQLDITLSGELDSQAVFGFFLYNPEAPPDYGEIDIELSRWGEADHPNGIFTVQPHTIESNSQTFQIPSGPGKYRMEIVRSLNSIGFSVSGLNNSYSADWSFSSAVPDSEDLRRVHVNLWLYEGKSPAGDGAIQVELNGFTYFP